MPRSHLRLVVRDDRGRVVIGARGNVFEADGTTPVAGMWNAPTGGAAVTSLVSNAQGELEGWVDAAKTVKVTVTDNGGTAFPAGGSAPFSFADFTESVDVGAIADVSAHEAAANPHPAYATDADLTAHGAAADPHPTYATDADLTAHGAASDPHPTYASDADLTAHLDAFHNKVHVPSTTTGAAIQTVVNAARDAGGGVVDLGGRTYTCTALITGASKVSIISTGGEATLDFTGFAGAGYCLDYAGSLGAQVLLSANATAGGDSITVADATGIAVGDRLLLGSDAAWKDMALETPGHKKGEIVVVQAISGTTLTLEAPLFDSYATADAARIKKLTQVTDFVLSGFFIKREAQQAASRQAIRVYCGERFRVENVRTDYATERGLYLLACRNFRVRGGRHDHCYFTGTGSSYGVSVADASFDGVIDGVSGYDHRHLVAIGKTSEVGVPRFIRTKNCVSVQDPSHTPVRAEPYDTHPVTQYCSYENNFAQGNNWMFNISGTDHIVKGNTGYVYGLLTEASEETVAGTPKATGLICSDNIVIARPDTPAGYEKMIDYPGAWTGTGNRLVRPGATVNSAPQVAKEFSAGGYWQHVFTDLPAGDTPHSGAWRGAADLSGVSQVRFCCTVAIAGSAGSKVRPQYSTDSGVNWFDLATTALEPSVLIDAVANRISAWFEIKPAAAKEVLLRIVAWGGNGVADPDVRMARIQVR